MSNFPFDDIELIFTGENKTKFGLFPLFAWYMMEIVELEKYFKTLTVKKKRNHAQSIERRRP